jgi:hypothetical protein
MTLARKIDRGVLVVAALALALPAFARANPLLSGYGGPGQGSQALLGSTLSGHSAGGRASEGTPPESALEAPATSTSPATAGASPTQSTGQPASRSSRHASQPGAGGAGTGGGPGSGGGSTGGQTLSRVALVPKSSVHTDAAGLSGGDLALIVGAIAVILATGMLMARLRPDKPHNGGT